VSFDLDKADEAARLENSGLLSASQEDIRQIYQVLRVRRFALLVPGYQAGTFISRGRGCGWNAWHNYCRLLDLSLFAGAQHSTNPSVSEPE
jgi:hypothetical protein